MTVQLLNSVSPIPPALGCQRLAGALGPLFGATVNPSVELFGADAFALAWRAQEGPHFSPSSGTAPTFDVPVPTRGVDLAVTTATGTKHFLSQANDDVDVVSDDVIIEALFKSNLGGAGLPWLIGCLSPGLVGWGLYQDQTADKLVALICDGTHSGTPMSTALQTATWYHAFAAISRTQNKAKLWCNGANSGAAASISTVVGPLTSGSKMYLCADPTTGTTENGDTLAMVHVYQKSGWLTTVDGGECEAMAAARSALLWG